MNIIWLGHGSFRIEIEDRVLLIDPWLTGNPMLSEDQHASATQGATHMLITHGHFDHTADLISLAKSLSIPVVGIYDFMSYFEEKEGLEIIGFNIGGAVKLGKVTVSMVPAMLRTAPGPIPKRSRAALAAAMRRGSLARPR